MNILVADDHPIVREGLQRLLAKEFPDADIGEAEDAGQLMERVRAKEWDLVLLDLSLPDRNGLECLEDIRRHCPDTRVLVLSMYTEDQFATHALRGGASGYIQKLRPPREILKAVHKVLGGGQYLSEDFAAQLAIASLRGTEGAPHEKLTAREFRIMCMIASGKTVSEIGTELSRSVKTISSHRVRILDKMGLRNNAELTHYCVRNGLV